MSQCYQPGSMNTSSWVQGSVNDEFLVKTKKATAVSVAVPVLDDVVKEICIPRGIKKEKKRINTIDLRQFKLHGHKLANLSRGYQDRNTSSDAKHFFLSNHFMCRWSYYPKSEVIEYLKISV